MKTESEETRDAGGEGNQPFLKPKFDEIALLIANDGSLHAGEAKSQRAAADNAKIYTRIEKDLHGNKDAAKAVRRLVKMEQSGRDDFLRTFEGLCDLMKLWPPQDLVDAAQNNGEVILSGGDRGRPQAVVQQAGVDYDPEGDDEDDADDADEDDAGVNAAVPDTPVAAADNVAPFRSALDQSKQHLGSTEPKAPPKPRTTKPAAKSGAAVH